MNQIASKRWLHWLVIAALCVAVFSNSLSNAPHLDDFYRVVDNPGIEEVWPIWRHFVDPRTMSTLPTITQFRPMLPLSLSLNYAVSGDSMVGFHVGNLALQIVCAGLVYELVRALFDRGFGIALAAGSMFGVHPVSGIVVNYVAARDLILMQLFLLLTLLLYLRLRRHGAGTMTWSFVILAMVLSLASKTNAVALPLLIVALERLVLRATWSKALTHAAPFVVIVAGFFFYTEVVLGFSDLAAVRGTTSALEYSLTQANLHFSRYFVQFLWPFTMRAAPRIEPSGFQDIGTWIGIVFIVGTLIVAWRSRRRTPIAAFLIVGYWALLLPTSSFLPLLAYAADYRPYPSSAFLYVGLSWFLLRGLGSRAGGIALCSIIVYFGAASHFTNRIWSTERSLWEHSVRHGGSALAHHNLAMSLPGGAVRERHLEEALRLKPSYTIARINLGRSLVHRGEVDAGIRHCERAVTEDPRSARARYWLGRTYADIGRESDARRALVRAADLDSANLEFQYAAARSLQDAGEYRESLRFLDRIQRQYGSYRRSRFLRGLGYQKLGRLREAIESYRAFLADHAGHGQAWFNLGHAWMSVRSWAQAIAAFETCLERWPGCIEAHYHLAHCFESSGDARKAKHHRKIWEQRRTR